MSKFKKLSDLYYRKGELHAILDTVLKHPWRYKIDDTTIDRELKIIDDKIKFHTCKEIIGICKIFYES